MSNQTRFNVIRQRSTCRSRSSPRDRQRRHPARPGNGPRRDPPSSPPRKSKSRPGATTAFARAGASVHNGMPEDRIEAIAALRRLRFTAEQIAETFAMPQTTVSGILTRIGMGRLGRLGLEPAQRYERKRPGELIHVDVKKLGRIEGGAGWRVRD